MDSQSTAQVLTEFFGYARDLSVVGVIILGAWKARGIWDSAERFILGINLFMKSMAEHADTLVNNHLKHLQDSANQIQKDIGEQTEILIDIKNRK